ncbi:MAG: PIG-L deacetylase family protein [Phycisphaerales bacterium]
MRILVVGPHPDDQELGMGASIARFALQGHDVLLLDATDGEPTPHGDHDTRAKEAKAATDILSPDPAKQPGAKPVKRLLLGLPNRRVEHTIAARHAVAGVIRAWQADVIFTPFFEDAHPDHRAITRIVEDARFDAKLTKIDMPTPTDGWTGQTMPVGDPIYPKWLFYYYATHLRWVANPSFILDATGQMEAKIDSIRAYHTQFVLPEKNRRVVEWVEAAARYFGSRIGTDAGEAFFTKEPVGLTSLDSLVS